jgi:ribosomal-protein-alanine N-acetyltransferase
MIRGDRIQPRENCTPIFSPVKFKLSARSRLLKKKIDHKASIITRPAERSDVHFVKELSRRVFHIYGPYKKIIGSWMESDVTVCLVGLIDNRPVGFAMISDLSLEAQPTRVSELLAIAVVPEKQGIGIGEALLREMEKRAAEMKITELFLHTAKDNLAALRLFRKNGYHAWCVKEVFYPAGQDAVFMSKQLGVEATGDGAGGPEPFNMHHRDQVQKGAFPPEFCLGI